MESRQKTKNQTCQFFIFRFQRNYPTPKNQAITGQQSHFQSQSDSTGTTFLRRRLEPDQSGWFLWLWGRRYQQRSDAQHARIALARKITRSAYFMCRLWQPYDDSQHRHIHQDHALKTAKRLANTAQELSAADIVSLEASAQLKQATKAINLSLGIHVSRYKLCPFDQDFPVSTLDLSPRAINLLLKNDIVNVSQLALRLVSGTLMSLYGLGQKTALEIEAALISKNIVAIQA